MELVIHGTRRLPEGDYLFARSRSGANLREETASGPK
jgi:hypothetical protein